jgi:hypothetical protein
MNQKKTELLVGIATWPLRAAWSGFALMLLWEWFVVPTFDVPPLALWQAIGLSITVVFVTFVPPPDYLKDAWARGLFAVLKPDVGISLGWGTLVLFK